MTYILSVLALGYFSFQDQRPSEIWEHIQKLGSNDIQVRENATDKLILLGNAAAPELDKAAKGSDTEVAERAKSILRYFRLEKTIPLDLKKHFKGLPKRLAFGGPEEWTKVFLEASRHNFADVEVAAKPSMEFLAENALRGSNRESDQMEILDVILRKDYRAATPAIVSLLTGRSVSVRGKALTVLRTQKAVEAVPALVDLLSSKDAFSRETGCRTLAFLGIREADQEIIPLLKDPHSDVRSAAVLALGQLKVVRAIPALRPLLEDKEPEVRSAAASALGDLGAKEAIEDLRKLLKDESKQVVGSAALALGVLNVRNAISELIALLKKDPSYESESIIHALVRLDAKEAGPELVRILERGDIGPSAIAAYALVELKATAEIPRIVEVLGNSHAAVRIECLKVLDGLGAEGTTGDIVRFLEDADVDVRVQAAKTLCRLGSDGGVPLLLQAAARDSQVGLRHLNRLRRGPVWHRLRTRAIQPETGNIRTTLSSLVSQITGMEVDVSALRFNGHITLIGGISGVNALDALEMVFAFRRDEFVLENKKIRLFSREDALTFWRSWWEKRKARER